MTPEQFLERYKTPCFYHFTDSRNLDSIRHAGGLLRVAEIGRRNMEIVAPGGNILSHEADVRLGLDEYVHLCLFPEHPMEYRARQDGRIIHSRFLKISTRVLFFENIRFTADVSNMNSVDPLRLDQACELMDFEVIYDRTDWHDPVIQNRRRIAKRYELLVPTDIPLNLISGF